MTGHEYLMKLKAQGDKQSEYYETLYNQLDQKAREKGNVIQIRMTERELELKQVPVSFFVKKFQEKVDKTGKMCGRFRY